MSAVGRLKFCASLTILMTVFGDAEDVQKMAAAQVTNLHNGDTTDQVTLALRYSRLAQAS